MLSFLCLLVFLSVTTAQNDLEIVLETDTETETEAELVSQDFTVNGKQVHYLGCFADGEPRDLGTEFISAADMDVQACAEHCDAQGTTYFSLEYTNECYCGNTYGTYGKLEADSCRRSCSGNSTQACGGNWKQSVYWIQDGVYPLTFPVLYENQACEPTSIFDAADVENLISEVDEHLSPDRCYEICEEGGYRYMAIYDTTECRCWNSTAEYTSTVSVLFCNAVCHGYINADDYPVSTSLQTACGTQAHVLAFELVHRTYQIEYVGCFSRFSGPLRRTYDYTALSCMRSCAQFGYTYSSTRLGATCVCGTEGAYTGDPNESLCDMSCSGDETQTCGGRGGYTVWKAVQVPQ